MITTSIQKILAIAFSVLLLSLYAGVGYGRRQLSWQDIDGQWAGVSSVGFRTLSGTFGIGYSF